MSQSIINKLFSFVITIQLVFFFIFVVENINDLDAISYGFSLGGESIEFEINVYATFAIIALLFLVVIISSISVFGSGLNEEGTKALSKYLGFIAMYIIFSMGINFYFGQIFMIGLILNLFMVMVYVMKSFELMGVKD